MKYWIKILLVGTENVRGFVRNALQWFHQSYASYIDTQYRGNLLIDCIYAVAASSISLESEGRISRDRKRAEIGR